MKFRMAFSATSIAFAGFLALAVGCSGCGSEKKRINAGGSTFVFPMMSTWASEYKNATGVEINYQSIGSGGGIQQMTAKTFDFGCTDAPMNDEQLAKAKETNGDVVHVPLAMGAVVLAYNLPSVKSQLAFSGPVLSDIFLGKIKKWNDQAIRALNPGIDLPDLEIVVVHRSDGSGTTYVFVDYLAKVSADWKSKVGVGTSVQWPVGIGAKGSEGVAGMVSNTNGALGYVELTYVLQNSISHGKVINKDGAAVEASLESTTAAGDNALKDIPEDLRYSVTNPAGKDSYPICGTVWAVVYRNQPKDKGKVIADFLNWVLTDGQEHCAKLHYARLPKSLIERAQKQLAKVAQ